MHSGQLAGKRAIVPHTAHNLRPVVLELEVVGAVLARVLAGLLARGAADAPVRAALLFADGAQQRRHAYAGAYLARQPRPGIGRKRGRVHLHEVNLGLGELDFAVLVKPTVDVLLEARGRVGHIGRHVAQEKLIVEPHRHPVHAQIQQVVEVFAACNPRVEGHRAIGVGVQGHAAAARGLSHRKPRPCDNTLDIGVEILIFVPHEVVPGAFLRRLVVVGLIEEKPGLRRDNRAIGRGHGDAVDGAREEVLRGHHLVVVDEDDGVVPVDGGDEQPQVAHRAVSGQRGRRREGAHAQLLHAAMHVAQLGLSDDGGVELREIRGDGAHLVGGLGLDASPCHHEQDNAPHTRDLLQALQTARQLARLVDGGHVVVDRRVGKRAAARRPIRRDNDDRV